MHQNLLETVWGPEYSSWALVDSYNQADLGTITKEENGEILWVIKDYQKLL